MSRLVEFTPKPERTFLSLEVTVDPNGAFKGIRPSKLLESIGLIPYFVQDTAMCTPESAEEAYKIMGECYGFPMSPLEGTLSDKGTYSYPGDPDLEPLVKFTMLDTKGNKGGTIEILVFQYAFVAVRDTESTLMTRMD